MDVSTAFKSPVLLWTRREAAAALGISERTLFDLTKATYIPRVRLGARGIRYPVESLRKWIEKQSGVTTADGTEQMIPC